MNFYDRQRPRPAEAVAAGLLAEAEARHLLDRDERLAGAERLATALPAEIAMGYGGYAREQVTA